MKGKEIVNFYKIRYKNLELDLCRSERNEQI